MNGSRKRRNCRGRSQDGHEHHLHRQTASSWLGFRHFDPVKAYGGTSISWESHPNEIFGVRSALFNSSVNSLNGFHSSMSSTFSEDSPPCLDFQDKYTENDDTEPPRKVVKVLQNHSLQINVKERTSLILSSSSVTKSPESSLQKPSSAITASPWEPKNDFRVRDPFVPPDHWVLSFSHLSHKISPPNIPSEFIHSNKNRTDYLSAEIWEYFLRNCQNPQSFEAKLDLWRLIDSAFRKYWKFSRTLAFGSTLNGFGTSLSDIDVCVFLDSPESGITGRDQQSNKKTRNSDLIVMKEMRKILRRFLGNVFYGNMEIVPAKIPILKVQTMWNNIEVDISYNKKAGVLNTNLLFCYSQCDWRVRPLVLAVKAWAKSKDINDARDGTFSSYTLTLMVINFLQCGVHPPVLPSLQVMLPRQFDSDQLHDMNIGELCRLPYKSNLPNFKSDNKMSLGDLFRRFFQHFTDNFDFTNDVACVRLGTVISNSDCEKYSREMSIGPGQWRAYIGIEEPLERTNAARAIVKRESFDFILEAFQEASDAIHSNSSKSLDHFLQ